MEWAKGRNDGGRQRQKNRYSKKYKGNQREGYIEGCREKEI